MHPRTLVVTLLLAVGLLGARRANADIGTMIAGPLIVVGGSVAAVDLAFTLYDVSQDFELGVASAIVQTIVMVPQAFGFGMGALAFIGEGNHPVVPIVMGAAAAWTGWLAYVAIRSIFTGGPPLRSRDASSPIVTVAATAIPGVREGSVAPGFVIAGRF